MKFTPRLEKAIRTAAYAHRNQTRKGSDMPYIVHPYSVMTIASQVTDDEDTLIACVFHDILEDVPEEYPEAKMRREFGDHVVAIVQGVSKDETVPGWRERCEAYMEVLKHTAPPESLTVAAADKIHNLMDTLHTHDAIGDKTWDLFTTKSPDDQVWWYESMLALLQRKHAPAELTQQLAGLVEQLHQRLGR